MLSHPWEVDRRSWESLLKQAAINSRRQAVFRNHVLIAEVVKPFLFEHNGMFIRPLKTGRMT